MVRVLDRRQNPVSLTSWIAVTLRDGHLCSHNIYALKIASSKKSSADKMRGQPEKSSLFDFSHASIWFSQPIDNSSSPINLLVVPPLPLNFCQSQLVWTEKKRNIVLESILLWLSARLLDFDSFVMDFWTLLSITSHMLFHLKIHLR